MVNQTETKTIIERHQISNFGNPISFARNSQDYGFYTFRDVDLLQKLEDIARLENKDGRVLCLEMVSLIKRLKSDCDELRKRFETMGSALDKINDNMKSNES